MKARSAAERSPETQSTRDAILDAAERHFAASGFRGASVREIATDAGLKNQASLYHHFRNKRALYEAVLARGLAPIVALVTASGEQAASAGTMASPQLLGTDGFLDRVIAYLVGHPQLPQLIQRAALDDKRYLRSVVSRTLRPLYAQGVAVLTHAENHWDDEQLPALGAGLYHLIFGYFANASLIEMVAQIDPLAPPAIEQQRRFLLRAVSQLLGGKEPARVRAAKKRS
jgi:AcrR family transcriptional regulator